VCLTSALFVSGSRAIKIITNHIANTTVPAMKMIGLFSAKPNSEIATESNKINTAK
jgi:hypothetical protein